MTSLPRRLPAITDVMIGVLQCALFLMSYRYWIALYDPGANPTICLLIFLCGVFAASFTEFI